MKNSLSFGRISFVFSVLLFACLSCSPPPRTETEPSDRTVDQHSVQELISTIQSTLNEGDLDGYMETVAEDAIFLPAGAPVLVGKPAIRAYWEERNFAELNFDLSFEFSDIQFVGDVAIAAGRDVTTDRAEEGSGGPPAINNDLHVYKKQADGSWKQWRIMWNSAAPSQPGV
jgi:uncharacterized protein (TIGR02246 family)